MRNPFAIYYSSKKPTNKIMKSIYFSLVVLFLFSCSTDDSADNCSAFGPANVETVVQSTTADAASFLFNVAFRVSNGCGQFSSFEQTTVGNVTTIQVIAKYEGCICTQDLPIRETVFIYNQTVSGTYTLKFKMADDNFVTKTVVIP